VPELEQIGNRRVSLRAGTSRAPFVGLVLFFFGIIHVVGCIV
jgi:hypothetical protein